MSVRDLIIIGAGPSGLSAAIAAKQRGLDYQVLEQGVLVNSIYRFPPQMVFFTTPSCSKSAGCRSSRRYEKPTRAEALRYYRRVVDTFDLQIAFDEKVLSVTASRKRLARTTLFAVETRSSRGVRRVRHARHVIFAIGYYDHPNLLDVPGEDLPHVHHYYTEPHPYYRQRVVIVGGGNSAAEAALEMYRAGAHVTLVHRGAGAQVDDQVLGAARHRKPDQGRIDRGALQHVRDGDPADVGRRQDRAVRRARRWTEEIASRRRVSADRLSRRLAAC